MAGISRFGVYIPKRRLQRSAIAAANSWFDASLKGHAKGERSMCNWDEDVVTMSVEAARAIGDMASPAVLCLASTTLPFADRQNSSIVMEALNLGPELRTMDVCGSLRAATSALLSALESNAESTLILAADNRRARAGSVSEMQFGDGAAALLVDSRAEHAKFLGGVTVSVDFIDHFRSDQSPFDYDWEERWVRDEGYLKIIPQAAERVFEKTGLGPADIDHLVLPLAQTRALPAVAKALKIKPEAVVDNLLSVCGQTGAAHSLVMLAGVLESAKAGEKILLIGFGQGCDAMIFEVNDTASEVKPLQGLQAALDNRVVEENYAKFQTFTGLVEREFGKRAEVDRSPALSAHNRHRKSVNGFIGGECRACGTVQFPKAHYCVNPNCGKGDTQDDRPMSNTPGSVKTYTADGLTFDMNPPAYFGLVEFAGGGRAMVDFSEVDPDNFDVGSSVRMSFRVKHIDRQRGYKTYFWKAVPV